MPSTSTLSVVLLACFLSAAYGQTLAPQREPYPLIAETIDSTHTDLTCPGGVINVVFAYWEGTHKTGDAATPAANSCGAVVTSRIRSKCAGSTSSCNLWDSTPVGSGNTDPKGVSELFGFDACVGFDKELHVYYNCVFSGLAYSRLALPGY